MDKLFKRHSIPNYEPVRPFSTLDPAFAQHRQDYLTRKQGKWPMRVIPAD